MKNQIDYQTLEVKLGNYDTINTTYNIPLPINSILKGVDVSKKIINSTTNQAIHCSVNLRQTDVNSNIRLDHELLNGSLYNSGDSTATIYQKRLSAILDIPIQKEGIELFFIFYNKSDQESFVNINWIVKNLEGGI